MSLSIDQFRGAKKRAGSRCVMAKIRDELDDEDRAVLDAALADRGITGSAIARVLDEAGHRISPNSVGHHRRGDCRCEQDGS